MRIFLFLITFCFLTILAYAGYRDDPKQGWHWYKDPTKQLEAEKQTLVTENDNKTPEKKEQNEVNTSVDNFQFPLTDEAKSVPVLANWLRNPTEANAKAWLAWQAKYIKHNEAIARSLRNAYLNHGDEVYRLEGMPEQPIASAVASRKETQTYQDIFNQVSEKVGIFFFYKKGCDFCEAEIAPLTLFANRYNFTVLGIVYSPEDELNLSFETRVSPSLFYRYQITSVPTIAAYHNNNMQIIAKGYTPVSQIELNLKAFLVNEKLITEEQFVNMWRSEDTAVLEKLMADAEAVNTAGGLDE
jgi:thiol-disulfide isomerase/thioredoxin